MVILHALGQCLVRTALTTISPRADMCFALSAYLARERGKRVPRRLLEGLFWPGIRPTDASHSLSELIHKLRRKGVPIQRDAAACIWLPREAIGVDVDQLNAEPPASLAERDLSILPGYSPQGSAAFNDWLDDWRNHLQLRVLDQVIAATDRAFSESDWPTTLALAEQALRIDPENAHARNARAAATEVLQRGRSPALSNLTAHGRFYERYTVALGDPEKENMSDRDDSVLVGRAAEMRCLIEECRKCASGGSSFVYLFGAVGVGKTRLLHEALTEMRSRGAVICSVSCVRHESARPLSAVFHAIPQLKSMPGAAGCDPGAVDCLDRVLRYGLDQPPSGIRLESPQPPNAIRNAIVELAEAITEEQPLALAFEDVDWIDSVSWDLLLSVAQKVRRSIFIICTSRRRFRDRDRDRANTCKPIEVHPLDDSESAELLTNIITASDKLAPDDYVRWCVRGAGGNPYFLEELARFWIAGGDAYHTPPSLTALTESRLECLSDVALQVLQAAAVLGANSTVELIETVLGHPTHQLLVAIEELGEAGLLQTRAEANGRSTSVLLPHDIVAKTSLAALSSSGRHLLHMSAARAIEKVLQETRSADLLWDCADHWRAAGNSSRFLSYTIACIEHLTSLGLVDEATARCSEALESAEAGAGISALLRARAHAEYAAHSWNEFRQTLTAIRELEGVATGHADTHDDLELLDLSAQRWLHRDWPSALAATLRCVHAADAPTNHRIQAAIGALKLASNLGELATMDSVYDAIRPFHLTCADEIQRLTLTIVYETIRGDVNSGTAAARELLAHAKRKLAERHQVTIMLDCASALRRGGDEGECESVCTEILRAGMQFQNMASAAAAATHLIEMHVDARRLEAAARLLKHCRGVARKHPLFAESQALRIAMARAHLLLGESAAAARLINPRGHRPLWLDTVTMSRSAALATQLRIELVTRADSSILARHLAELNELHTRLRSIGTQDYETFSLYLGVRELGQPERAAALLMDYVRVHRRDKPPLSSEIASELDSVARGYP